MSDYGNESIIYGNESIIGHESRLVGAARDDTTYVPLVLYVPYNSVQYWRRKPCSKAYCVRVLLYSVELT